jgi:BASS family bile acid:Na+ symporter
LALSVVLTTISTVLSFVTIPLFFWCFELLLPTGSVGVQIPISDTLLQLVLLILLPVTMGGYCCHRWPEVTKNVRSSFQRTIQLVLYLVVAIIFYQQWNVVSATLLSALSWSLGLCFGTLAIGYGMSQLTRLPHSVCATVAIECSIRNLAVAFLVASNILDRIDVAVIPMVYFIAVLFVGIGFSLSWKRVHSW